MEWLQAFMIAGSTIGACYWMNRENKIFQEECQKEFKDFHGRLCTLEERYMQMMERFLAERNQK
jgi:hypothetical protein